MIVYNVTVNVDSEIEEIWIRWMKQEHIPKMLETTRFYDAKILKLLNDQPDATGTTYAVQYFSNNIGQVEAYLNNEAEELRNHTHQKFGDKIAAFRTVLEEV